MAEKTMDKLKKIFGFAEDYEYEDFDDEYTDDVSENEIPETTSVSSVSSHKPVKTRTNSASNMIITVHEPLTYDESPLIVDDLRDFKAVVLNFEQLDIDVKRQIFDFVSGALYALDGKMQKVNKDIFILAPNNVEIDGLKEQLKNNGMFPW
ncbi:cell division protein SepF [Peptoniphilus sp. MSJ-1]|uniref:Cell division protein SepF n=1 Tax=Peptoniphilus ovalis TaxID=2841503 RepID=A0ABS6FFX8_9FIRM|nr:cell division protein SepF [Peptoniphilus ovalis]MBU5669040.1 cell division protein SepF [Peptoniphilus ovalis]